MIASSALKIKRGLSEENGENAVAAERKHAQRFQNTCFSYYLLFFLMAVTIHRTGGASAAAGGLS